MKCVELVEGCADCEAEGRYLESRGHECGTSTELFVTACEAFGDIRRSDEKFHRLVHEPTTCDGCGAFLSNMLGVDRHVVRPCRSGLCRRWLCPSCGREDMSDGPVNCPSCGSLPKRAGRISLMHSKYRHKSGGRR